MCSPRSWSMNQRPTRFACSVTGSSDTTCPLASSRGGPQHRGRILVGQVVEEVDHQHEVEALALGHQLGRIDAPERMPLVAAAATSVLDVGAVEVDAEVAAARERRVLPDPAADVEDARLAVQQPPTGEQRPPPPVQPEAEVERGAARFPHDRTVEEAHSG